MTKTFLVLGDSWSQGEIELQQEQHVVVHQGLVQYLKDDGYKVINGGGLGWSNKTALEKCKELYTPDIDYVIWFVTDSLRDLTEQEYIEQLRNSNSIRQVVLDNHNKIYKEFDQLGIPIYLIGGWAPVLPNVSDYKNLKVIINCLHEYFVPDSQVGLFHSAVTLLEHVKQSARHHPTPEVMQEVIELIDEDAHARMIRNNNPKWFYPDNNHANRHGHKRIYERIQEVML